MDKKTRNLELEAWLIETTGEEMMANHLGPNWNRFNEEMGFYPNISMTIADQVWQHQQAKVEELTRKLSAALGDLNVANKNLRDRFSAFQMVRQEADGLQRRVDKALQEIKGAARWIDEDAINDPDFIKGGALRALKRLEQALKGEV